MMYLNLLFSAAILAFLIAFDLCSLKYSLEAKIFPWVVGIPATILMLIVTLKEISRLRQATHEESLSKLKDIDFRPYALIIAWMTGLLIMIYVLGFYAGPTLFVFLYLKTKGLGWRRSLGLAAGLFMAIYLLFSYGMEMRLDPGLIYSLYMR